MNRLIYFVLILLVAVVAGCAKSDGLLYSDKSRIQLNDTSTLSTTFFYEAPAVTRDTVYIQVNTIGKLASYDREVKMVQVPEANVTNAAVPGIHYVAMDDASLKNLMVVKANAVKAMVPVVLLRNPALKDQSFRLRLELVSNDQFGLGEVGNRARTVVFSDRLERFFSWRFDTGVAPAFYTFGKYSQRKHQFIYETLHEQIDEAWYQAAVAIGAQQNYGNLLKQALITFNNDPANIASGVSPLRETSSSTSPVITFP
jgi:hypothetical protein